MRTLETSLFSNKLVGIRTGNERECGLRRRLLPRRSISYLCPPISCSPPPVNNRKPHAFSEPIIFSFISKIYTYIYLFFHQIEGTRITLVFLAKLSPKFGILQSERGAFVVAQGSKAIRTKRRTYRPILIHNEISLRLQDTFQAAAAAAAKLRLDVFETSLCFVQHSTAAITPFPPFVSPFVREVRFPWLR